MEENRSNSAQNLGIAALIIGIITFVLAVIPCVGIIAIIPGVVAVVLATVGLSQASRNNSPRGVIVAGLVISSVAVIIAFSQIFVAGRIARDSDKWPRELKDAIDEVRTEVMQDLEDANVNIRIESNGDTIEINASSKSKDDKVRKLEELESGKGAANDTTARAK
jgi:membrane-bound ClpP family serine protease